MPLNPVTVAEHAARAGWRGVDLVTAVAVAYAASGGFPERAGGLWALPGEPGGDAAGNAVKAHARWSAGGWGQWPAYTSRKYLIFMPPASAAVAAASVKNIIDTDTAKAGAKAVQEAATSIPVPNPLDAARDALTLAQRAGSWLSNSDNWVRIARVVVGGGMIIAAVVMVVRPYAEQPLLNAASKLKKVIPV